MATSLSDALGTKPKVLPVKTPAPAPAPEPGAAYLPELEAEQKKLEAVGARKVGAETVQQQLAQESATEQARQRAAEAAGMSDIYKQASERIAAAPGREELEQKIKQEKDYVFQPSHQDGMQFATLASLIMTLGFSIGKGGKSNAMAALAGMNGMMEGYRKGSDAQYEREKKTFEVNSKALKDQITSIRQALENYEKNVIRDRDAAVLQLRQDLAKQGADFIASRVDRQSIVNVLPEIRHQEQTLQKNIDLIKRKIDDAKENHRRDVERAEQARISKEQTAILSASLRPPRQAQLLTDPATGKIYKFDSESGEFTEIKTPEGVRLEPLTGRGGKSTTLSQQQQQFENITSADIGNAYFRINEWLSGVKDSEKIPTGSKFLRDKGTQSGIIEAYKNYLVNKTMPKDLQANDAALLGIAFDIVAARAFGRASGVTDAKIAQVVRQLPVEGDSEETKALKMRVLFNQLHEPNRLLSKNKQVDGSEYMTSPVAKKFFDKYSKGSEGTTDELALQFNSEEEVDHANLPAGTIVIVNGKKAKVK